MTTLDLDTSNSLQVFTLGGTIDKIYFDALSEYKVGKPQISTLFQDAGLSFQYDTLSICSKDSLDITDEDRLNLLQEAVKTPHHHILVTHGTDTMKTTAQYLQNAAAENLTSKTIVFVGAMNPACFKHSDAPFNVGFALGALRALKPGIYLAMSGSIFNPNEVIKNRAAGQFQTKLPLD